MNKNKYTLKVQTYFNAAHNLRGYRGRCEKLHGHNWRVQVQVSAYTLNKIGMVCDFKQIKEELSKVLVKLDHSYLNKLAFFKINNPTSEKIAEFIFNKLKKNISSKRMMLQKVAVWETETCCAEFSLANSEDV